MQEIAEYVQDLKKQLKMQDNQELAERLHIDEQTVLKWCNGEEIPDEDTCIQLAYIAKEDPAKVLILKHLSSASKDSRDFWEKISVKYRYGRTLPNFLILKDDSQFDRRNNVIKFTGADQRLLHDRRRGQDRRLLLAS